MSHDKRRDEDFAGLGRTEARQLEETADTLRGERHEPEDPAFWDALEQRIMNEVAVKPIAGQQPANRALRSGPLSRLGALMRRTWRQRLTSGALAVAVVTVLVLLILSKDRPQEPSQPVPEPSMADRLPMSPQLPFQNESGIAIPEELWLDGFLAHGTTESEALLALEADGVWLDDDATDDGSDSTAPSEWATFDWPAGDSSLEALAADFDWGLVGLDDAELEILAELLDG